MSTSSRRILLALLIFRLRVTTRRTENSALQQLLVVQMAISKYGGGGVFAYRDIRQGMRLNIVNSRFTKLLKDCC